MNDLMFRLSVALAIGLVVGVERGWQSRELPAGARAAGVRTFALVSFTGGVFAALAKALESPAVLIAGLIVSAAILAFFSLREMREQEEYSVTGLVAALVVFGLGSLSVLGETSVAGAAGIAVAGLLASRRMLHRLLERMTWSELRSALILLVMSFIVLPLLPDRTVDPFGSVNPRQVWTFTVLTAALSYAGYVAVRVAGPQKGILLSGLGGGLVSSTATTIAFARRSAAGEAAGLLAGGAVLAGLVSIVRVLIILIVVAPAVLPTLLPPALAALAVLAIGAGLLMRHADSVKNGEQRLGNPFDLQPLLIFAAGFAAICALSGWLLHLYGAGSLVIVSAAMGLADVDVATLNAGRLAGNGVPVETAAHAILATLGVNAVARTCYGIGAGVVAFWGRLVAVTAAALAAGGAALFLPGL